MIEQGKTYGLVGESGSGKSTTGKAIIGLEKITNGEIIYQGQDVTKPRSRKAIGYNKDVQMIFQDSMSSLNPKKRVLDIIAEPIRNFERLSDQEEKKKSKVCWILWGCQKMRCTNILMNFLVDNANV